TTSATRLTNESKNAICAGNDDCQATTAMPNVSGSHTANAPTTATNHPCVDAVLCPMNAITATPSAMLSTSHTTQITSHGRDPVAAVATSHSRRMNVNQASPQRRL